MDLEAAIQQAVHNGPGVDLEGAPDLLSAAVYATQGPLQQQSEARAGVREGLLAQDGAGGIEDAGFVRLCAPVDVGAENRLGRMRPWLFLFVVGVAATLGRSLDWCSKARTPYGRLSRHSPGAQAPQALAAAGGNGVLPGS